MINFVLIVVFISVFLAFNVTPFTTVLVSAILLLICIAAVPQLMYSFSKHVVEIVSKICWAFILLSIVALSIIAFSFDFVSNFAVFTFIMAIVYCLLMAAGGIQFYNK